MRYLTLVIALLLASCGKASDQVATSFNGYALRCIEGNRYILLTSERGLAITPLLGSDGKPKECSK